MSDIAIHMRTLNISYGASADDVKAAWRAAVKKFHPDVAGADTTQEMVRINAAYEALKGGSPAKPKPAAPKPRAKPASSQQASAFNLYPFQVNAYTYNVSDKTHQSWQRTANNLLDKSGVPRPKAGLFKKIRRQTPDHKVFIPERFVTSRNNLLIKFRGGFPKGKVRFLLPKFSVENQVLHMASLHEIQLFELNSYQRNNTFMGVRLPELDGSILPHLNLKIQISAY